MSTFVLVHGAYHGVWCWEQLVGRLELAGHQVVAADLPGHGATSDPTQMTLAHYADATASLVAGVGGSAGDDGVHLVGHSMAGAVIAEAAERVPELLSSLIFLTAYLPRNGQSVANLARMDEQVKIDANKVDVDGVPCLELDEATLRKHFYADANEEQINWASERIQVQAIAPFLTPVALSEDRFGRVPRSYIHCERDRAIGLFLQRRMEADAPCAQVRRLPGGHSPFITDVDALASLLQELTA